MHVPAHTLIQRGVGPNGHDPWLLRTPEGPLIAWEHNGRFSVTRLAEALLTSGAAKGHHCRGIQPNEEAEAKDVYLQFCRWRTRLR
jgi:hypothetical protein